MFRRALLAFLYSSYVVIAATALVWFFFWRPMVTDLARTQRTQIDGGSLTPPSGVTPATMRRLGSLRADRTSSFVNFRPDKPNGTTRICALGDSFTYGDEVADGLDFPALLEDLFQERGYRDIEVLNFGNSWHGFHQAYIVWTDIGRHYGCDYVLLGPGCFQPDRDSTFNHGLPSAPYYLHARFVFAEDQARSSDGEPPTAAQSRLRLIEPLGDTRQQRFDEYFAFLPRAIYLRYDRNPPAALQSLLPAGRWVENPAYYRRDSMREEAYTSYQLLLTELASEGPQIVLLHSDVSIAALAKNLELPNLVAAPLYHSERFPDRAVGGHASGFGNRAVAEAFFAALVETPQDVSVVRFEDRPSLRPSPANAKNPNANNPNANNPDAKTPKAASPVGGMPAPASNKPLTAPSVESYRRIVVTMDGVEVGVPAIASTIPSERQGSPEALTNSGAVSWIAVLGPQMSILDAGWLRLDRRLDDNEAVTVTIRSGKTSTTREIGPLVRLHPSTNIGVVVVPGLRFDAARFLFRAEPAAPPAPTQSPSTAPAMPASPDAPAPAPAPGTATPAPAPGTPTPGSETPGPTNHVSIRVGPTLVLEGRGTDPTELGAVGPVHHFRTGESFVYDPALLGKGGSVALHLETATGETTTIPLAKIKQETIPLTLLIDQTARLPRPIRQRRND